MAKLSEFVPCDGCGFPRDPDTLVDAGQDRGRICPECLQHIEIAKKK